MKDEKNMHRVERDKKKAEKERQRIISPNPLAHAEFGDIPDLNAPANSRLLYLIDTTGVGL